MGKIFNKIGAFIKDIDWKVARKHFEDNAQEHNDDDDHLLHFFLNENGQYQYVHLREKFKWFSIGYRGGYAHQEERYHETLLAAKRYIVQCGMNQIMKGEPHPQQLLLDQINEALGVTDDEE